ncbi:hypothetical protein [Hoeflea sp.]|uniref:hypothetical protein n=1 Tax=Hoeflea sp. TaxID=1940281 RepID=UPI003BAFD46C
MKYYSDTELYDLTFRVCVASVKEAYPHIPVAVIIDPPHGHFEASFARQIAVHLIIARFGIPKRRAGKIVDRKRWSIGRAVEVVDRRLEEPEFEEQYRIIAERAESLYQNKLLEVA